MSDSKTLMQIKLEELGCRIEGDFISHAGIPLKVKWEIERLYVYPYWIRTKAIEDFIWEVGKLRPHYLFGIKTGGLLLAKDVGEALNEQGGKVSVNYRWCHQQVDEGRTIIMDDVLTTGGTVRGVVKEFNQKIAWAIETENKYKQKAEHNGKIVAIAVLVNRSQLTEIEGIPIISGFFADEVKSG